MQQLQGWRKFDDWGSQSAIAEFLGETPGFDSGRLHRTGSEEGPGIRNPLRLWKQSSLPHEGHRTR